LLGLLDAPGLFGFGGCGKGVAGFGLLIGEQTSVGMSRILLATKLHIGEGQINISVVVVSPRSLSWRRQQSMWTRRPWRTRREAGNVRRGVYPPPFVMACAAANARAPADAYGDAFAAANVREKALPVKAYLRRAGQAARFIAAATSDNDEENDVAPLAGWSLRRLAPAAAEASPTLACRVFPLAPLGPALA
jgi:hypothetical protein